MSACCISSRGISISMRIVEIGIAANELFVTGAANGRLRRHSLCLIGVVDASLAHAI